MAVLPTGIGPVTGYNIERSLRFNSADSAYLNRTPGSASNRKTWTWSGWVKRSAPTTTNTLFSSIVDGNNFFAIRMRQESDNGRLEVLNYSSAYDMRIETTQVFRDVSAWGHLVVALDTTQATSTNRVKIYWNGSQITALSTTTYPSQNFDTDVNNTNAHYVGSEGAGSYHNGYLTEINFIDGQALTPSSFGETDAATGVWKPKAYSGTYGTNGFFLKFADNSGTTSTTLGKDSSGNSNNWTPNNFSVTAGAGNDSLVDSPTAYGTDTGVGGEVRGNYATLNPLQNGGITLTNGNLDGTSASGWFTTFATMGVSSGKWYWEGTCTRSSGNEALMGIVKAGATLSSYVGVDANGWCYYTSASSSLKINNASSSSYGATYTNGDVIGVALDLDAGTLVFYKNGTSQGTAYSSLSGQFFPAISVISNSAWVMNFGQRAFAYTAPSGFKALCTTNLPTPTIGATSTTQANDYFNPVLYTGTGSSLSVTGVGFQPDWVWIKGRSGATDHGLYDAVRGVQKQLESNTTTAETTETTGLTAFGSDGFTVGALAQLNTSSATYVSWNWNAGGSNATNTSGTITSTVRANTTSGFSIVSFALQATGSKTVGHGLGVAPAMIIIKGRDTVQFWPVYHQGIGNTKFLGLNIADAAATNSTVWDDTSPTSSVFTVGSGFTIANYGTNQIAYCFAPVAGYSAFGSYTGNGAADGPFVYTGFRPRYVLIKNATDTGGNAWLVFDTARDTYNVTKGYLAPNNSNAENTASSILDMTSNGFKLRDSFVAWNGSANTIIYAAFAESPFKYSLAR